MYSTAYSSENPTAKPWLSCNMCGYTYQNYQELSIHIQSTHGELGINTNDPVVYGRDSHRMPLINVHCNFCEEIFSSMHTLNVHTAISHAGQLSGCGCDAHCDQCTSTFSNATLLNTHIKEQIESEMSYEQEQGRVSFLQPSTISGDNLDNTSDKLGLSSAKLISS